MSKRWDVPDGCTHAANRDALSARQLETAERLAFELGEGYDSYLLLEAGRQYFFGRGDCGVVGFSTWRNHAYVVGGLLAATAHKRLLLADFLEFARRNGLEVSFLNVLASDLAVFRERGFQVSKVGEEPVIDLDGATWQGGDFAWVRRQENYCVRQRVRCAEVDAAALPGLAAELHEVSREHLGDTVYNRELSLMVGRVDLEHLFRKRVFVARREGRVEAFVVAAPACGGNLWAVETFRRRPTATRGVIPCLILQIAKQLRDEGVRVLSLCQVPALRVDRGTPSDSRLVVNGLRFWWNWLPWFYDPPRLYHFKSRFRPQYRECFIATYPRSRFVPLLAFFFKWGVIWPSFARLPQQMLRRMKKWGHVERLADPAAESYVIVERLPATGSESFDVEAPHERPADLTPVELATV